MEKYFIKTIEKQVVKVKVNLSKDIKNHIIECVECGSEINIEDYFGTCPKCKNEFVGPLLTS